MTSEREERPGRQFAGEPQAKRSRGEWLGGREANQARRAPGRSTLAESLDPAPIDVVRVLDAQLEVASCQLVVLQAANHEGNHHASGMAAAGIRTALRIAETMVARARVESGDRAGPLQRRLAGIREVARVALEQAFRPTAAAKHEVVDGVGRSQWHREVTAWRAARGLTALEAASAATAPEARAAPGSMDSASSQHATAAEGVAGAAAPLPHLDEIQRAFGRHDVTGVRAQVGGTAAQAARTLGAAAYATGSSVAFAASPDLHTAAHEAAHIVQQRAGVVLDGGFGTAGDRYERHADAVADRVVAGRSAELLLDAMIGSSAGVSPSRFAIQRKDDPTARSSGAAPAEPWQHLFGAESTPVNKLGRVQAPRGRTLLQKPSPGSAPSMPAPLPFDARVMVVRRTVQSTAAERWCYVTAPDHGAAGFCEERYLAIDPPEPRARLHRVEGGETLGKIVRDAYGQHITAGNNERLYVQGLYEANKDRAGVKLTPVQLSLRETWHRREAEEETLEVYRGVQVLKGMSLWIPSNEFIQRLKASGAITSGSSELSKAWRAAAEFVDDAIDAVKYAAGFIVGLLEGAWSAIVDLFKGAFEMIETIATVLYHLVTMNPWRIKDMLMKWVDKMKSAWEHRGQIADEFMKKWNAPSGWDRGRFQGEVLGWVMMTVLIIIVTAGSGAAANAGSLAARFPQVVKLLKTVDAVGDVTTYLGGAIKGIKAAGRLPEAAAEVVKGKLGKADDIAGDATKKAEKIDSPEAHAPAGDRAPDGPAAATAELQQVFRRAKKIKDVQVVSLKRLQIVLGKAGAAPGNHKLVKATRKQLDALGDEASQIFGWVGRDGAGQVIRDARGRPIITFTPKGLSSLEQAVKTFGHEAKHLKDFAAGLATSSEALAEEAGQKLWMAVQSMQK